MSYGWEPLAWTLGFFPSRTMKRGFELRTRKKMIWQNAADTGWPVVAAQLDDDWLRHVGKGLVAGDDEERFFIIDRDWFGWPDPPRFSLASIAKSDGQWRVWGSFDTMPAAWTIADSQS